MKNEVYKKESELFPPIKKYFKDLGYKVYAEVPSYFRNVDCVAVKENEHIAVEMKLRFNDDVFHQASSNRYSFHKSYVAFPVKKAILCGTENGDIYWNFKEKLRRRIDWCRNYGIGILEVVGTHQIVFESMEGKYNLPKKVYDFSTFSESDNDEAGIKNSPNSSAKVVIERIKKYVREHPKTNWNELHIKIQHHYAHKNSFKNSITIMHGFDLEAFRETLMRK